MQSCTHTIQTFFNGDSINELSNIINTELNKIVTWLQANKLSLNVSKSNFMLFTNKKVHDCPEIKINNEILEHVITTKFLGFQLDHKLGNHIYYILKGKCLED